MSNIAWIAIIVSRIFCILCGGAVIGYFYLAASNRGDWFVLFPGLVVGGIIIAVAFAPAPSRKQLRSRA